MTMPIGKRGVVRVNMAIVPDPEVVNLRTGNARELRKHVTILEREIAMAKAHAVRLGRTVAHSLIDLDGIDDAAHLFARPALLVLARAGANDEHQFSPRHDPEF